MWGKLKVYIQANKLWQIQVCTEFYVTRFKHYFLKHAYQISLFFLFFLKNVNSLITALDSVTAWKWCHNSETCLIGCNVGGVGLCLVLLPRWRQAEVWSRPLPSGGSSAAAPFCSSDGNRILESHWETRTSCQHMITLSRSLFFWDPSSFCTHASRGSRPLSVTPNCGPLTCKGAV